MAPWGSIQLLAVMLSLNGGLFAADITVDRAGWMKSFTNMYVPDTFLAPLFAGAAVAAGISYHLC